jgi:type II secretory pathway component PulF
LSLTRENVLFGVRDGRWSHSSGQDILDLLDRMKDAEARALRAEAEVVVLRTGLKRRAKDGLSSGSDLLSALKKAREALKYATDLVIATGEADNRCAEALRAIAKYTESE